MAARQSIVSSQGSVVSVSRVMQSRSGELYGKQPSQAFARWWMRQRGWWRLKGKSVASTEGSARGVERVQRPPLKSFVTHLMLNRHFTCCCWICCNVWILLTVWNLGCVRRCWSISSTGRIFSEHQNTFNSTDVFSYCVFCFMLLDILGLVLFD